MWEAGRVTDLGRTGEAEGINRVGQIAGYAIFGGTSPHAFVWQGGVMTDLDPANTWDSLASAINDAGQVVGYRTIGPSQHAMLWQHGAAQDLGVLPVPGNSLPLWSWAQSVNNLGQIVGSSGTQGVARAFIYENGNMTDLNSLIPARSGWILTGAIGIDDQGLIVGQGLYNGWLHGFLLTPR